MRRPDEDLVVRVREALDRAMLEVIDVHHGVLPVTALDGDPTAEPDPIVEAWLGGAERRGLVTLDDAHVMITRTGEAYLRALWQDDDVTDPAGNPGAPRCTPPAPAASPSDRRPAPRHSREGRSPNPPWPRRA